VRGRIAQRRGKSRISPGGTTITMAIGDPKRLYPRPALTSKAVPN
jgi:hypothetical protein